MDETSKREFNRLRLENKALVDFHLNHDISDLLIPETQEIRIGDFFYIFGNRELIIYSDEYSEDEVLSECFVDIYNNTPILVRG